MRPMPIQPSLCAFMLAAAIANISIVDLLEW